MLCRAYSSSPLGKKTFQPINPFPCLLFSFTNHTLPLPCLTHKSHSASRLLKFAAHLVQSLLWPRGCHDLELKIEAWAMLVTYLPSHCVLISFSSHSKSKVKTYRVNLQIWIMLSLLHPFLCLICKLVDLNLELFLYTHFFLFFSFLIQTISLFYI